jgi:hypothetical protein
VTLSWLDEVEPVPGPPFLRMGTRALTARDWLLGGADVPELLAEKRRILDQHHDEVFAALDGTHAAADELLAELLVEPGAVTALNDTPTQLHPLDLAGRLVAEDLCLLVRREAGWVLGAGSVCFPSHWQLAAKLGHPVAEVHAPVPHYPAELAARVDRLIDRLRVGPGVWRRNWTVHTSARLFAPIPPPPPDPPVTVADAAERLWFRSEYQTLRRLPRSGAIVFGIRTQQVPLGQLAGRPDLCRRLAETAESWSPGFLAYRGGEDLKRPFLAWLHWHQGD